MILLIISTILFFNIIKNNIANNSLKLATIKLQEISSNIILKNIKDEITNQVNNDLLIINKNKSDEIISIDYDLNNSYKILNKVIENVQNTIKAIENGDGKIYIDEPYFKNNNHGLIVYIPSFNIFNNPFLAGLGPKIPAKIYFIGEVKAFLETKVTNYGMNNGLLEIYLNISILNSIVLPNTKEKSELNMKLLIAAKSIQGRIPFQYNEKISIPIE